MVNRGSWLLFLSLFYLFPSSVKKIKKSLNQSMIYKAWLMKSSAWFNVFQSFTWNLGRPVDEVEVLQLSVVSRGVLKNEKVLAKYGLVLQTVIREGRIIVTDSLVDLNNKPLPVRWNTYIPMLAITVSAFNFISSGGVELPRSEE